MTFQARWRHSKVAPNHCAPPLALRVPSHCLPRKGRISGPAPVGCVGRPGFLPPWDQRKGGSSLQEVEPQPASLIHSLDGTELDVSLFSPLLWLLSLIINRAAFSPPPKPQSGSSSLYPNSLPPFVVEKVVGHQRQSLGCRRGLPKYSPLTLSASSAAHPGGVTRRGQEGRWGSPSPGSLPLS